MVLHTNSRTAKADPEQQEKFIHQYNDIMNSALDDEVVLFGDGVHPTISTKVTYGWIKKGQDKPIKTTASRTRMNILGIINLENMRIMTRDYDSLNQTNMSCFLRNVKEEYSNASKIHLILDQGSYNTSKMVKETAWH